RISASISAFHGRRGRNEAMVNWGGDPLTPYTENAPMEFGNYVGQGISQTETRLTARASFELLPSLFVEGIADYASINEDSPNGQRSYLNVSGGIRWGLPYQSARY
ncbi:MAG: hypothetical protein R3284_09415, partial [Rubricoccaceae bacterium]|nr:hypothetical protein [Rubricoccaceae bacterium]